MNRRSILQGGLASLAGVLLAKHAGASVEESTLYYAAVARTCNSRVDAVYSRVVANPRPPGVNAEQREIDLHACASVGVLHAMKTCRAGRCAIGWMTGGDKKKCDWGHQRTNVFFYPSDNREHVERELRAEGYGIFIYQLTRAKYEALDAHIKELTTRDHNAPWFFQANRGVQVTEDVNLFRR